MLTKQRIKIIEYMIFQQTLDVPIYKIHSRFFGFNMAASRMGGRVKVRV